MKNLITINISNNTGIDDKKLYVFITDGNNNFYKVDSKNNWTATAQNTACSVLLSDLPSTNGIYTFYYSASLNMTGGRIWFSTSETALSLSGGKIVQPSALSDFVFDFMELATTAKAGKTPGNANIDITQVDALGIPITLFVNPTENNLTFPPTPPTSTPTYGYPNVIGIEPWRALNQIIDDFKTNIKGTVNAPFDACDWKKGKVRRFVAPVHVIDNYSSGSTPSSLATFLDTAIYQFFKHYMTNTLSLQDPVSENIYTGQVTTVDEVIEKKEKPTRRGEKPKTKKITHTYNVLQFDCEGEKLNIYFPYFTTNCAAMPGELTKGVALAPPPTWWKGNLNGAMPATAMVLGCAGVFSDSTFQPKVTNNKLLGNLENQVVSLITRAVTPMINNLVSFQAQFSAADIKYNQATVTVSPFPTGLKAGMDVVKQIAAQPSNIVSVDSANNKFTLTSSVDALLPVGNSLFICGEFYPGSSSAEGYSNAYAKYLHKGMGTTRAPLLNGIGYAFAYDDQGGYSNDITVNYDSDNSLTVGVFLGPLKVEALS
jgi:hypothetical protein